MRAIFPITAAVVLLHAPAVLNAQATDKGSMNKGAAMQHDSMAKGAMDKPGSMERGAMTKHDATAKHGAKAKGAMDKGAMMKHDSMVKPGALAPKQP